ncbi:ribosyldihydronicotinamide dehydrogenase [quinone]-like [Sorex fumeus]|uniref:ribosyldihydronicotinamide dehydrogenase [quinone]-like n=1 Tax=Sorex fumeus TaxID=62283 RepID=UPI0024AD2944|nr:ribosyldihydronicotinamide dehydrogenase [quinone]-like [Sorex fumeus]XP_055964513.1 ribosyldihydronicotinamide dehydrogenase [quinone]-like [Sorex fumeus]XP_055964514.1 ribosyldihydronicotinamide dehydrogenase [quinone]-like [Sorex fumeus]XP_055964515.1 ribosyldihydronicotinamide dehydrogenase [quinone]-like [Sorex fumeus]XP_055964516.1 ribosyldihydronicotinamide dehydrogenase [quinone]-like [Sorex fumeus]
MAGKKVLIVYAHQDPGSFNAALKKAAVEELSKQGCLVTVSDLYAMDFEPRTMKKDFMGPLSDPEHFNYALEAYQAYQQKALSPDIMAEQEKLLEADLVIFQFPLYWYSLPAILKGWMDRVFCQGFAFNFPKYFESGLLKGKRAVLSITTGGPANTYSKTGSRGDIRCYLWPIQHGTLHFCGFQILAPQISFAPDRVSQEEREGMVAAWVRRLAAIWEEAPIDCTAAWYFGQ